MEALIIFGFFLVLIIKHFGACGKESYEIELHRRQAEAKGDTTYWSHGYRDVATGHLLRCGTDKYLGRYHIDTVTGKITYTDIERVYAEYEEQHDKKGFKYKLTDGHLWSCDINNHFCFIDIKTKEMYFVAHASDWESVNHTIGERANTYFYVSCHDPKHVIKKTQAQIRVENENPRREYFTMEELENFEDRYGTRCRTKEGNWIPVNNFIV